MRRALLLIIALVMALSALAAAPTAQSAGELAPQVVETTPTRGEELPLSGEITFYFDQAMDKGSVEAAFKANPAVKGTFEWPNESTAVFHPSAPLQRAATYMF